MMTPDEFMMSEFRRSLGSLHWRTALLESCNWDEETMDTLLEDVSSLIKELHDLSTTEERKSPIILVALRQRLRAIAGDKQIDILMNLLQAETALVLGGMEASNGHVGLLQEQAEA